VHGGGIQDKSRKVPEKFGGKEAGKVGGKEAGKVGGKEAEKVGGKEAGKVGGKEVGKVGGKMLLNKPLKGKKKSGGAATALPTPPT
jgi:hypothetical protein